MKGDSAYLTSYCNNYLKEFENHKKASEASYVYILSGQKFIKNAKNGQFWRVFENLKFEVKQCYQQKLVENAKIEKLKCDILDYFEHCDSVGNFFQKSTGFYFIFRA